MKDIVIVEAARTPVGKFRGSLGGVRADHLGAVVLQGLLRRTGLAPEAIDDVIFGCVTQVGEQSANIARTALLSAGWPHTIPGMTVDRKCGSAEAAVHVAVGQIASGMSDVVIAGGAENMTRVPMGGNRDVHGEPYGGALQKLYDLSSQGEAAERIIDKWELKRAELEAFAVESHRRAGAAADAGWFDREIEAVDIERWREPGDAEAQAPLSSDETIRRGTTAERLASLKPSFRANGRVTAGTSSQISDGAAAVLLMSREAANRNKVRPRARIRAMTVVGSDPELMLTGPISATRQVLEKAGLTASQIDLFEVNEAFAPVPMIWLREIGASHEQLNVNGGAIALGHPLGASGARIMTTLLAELDRRGARFGLQAICCNGGLATATVIERLDGSEAD